MNKIWIFVLDLVHSGPIDVGTYLYMFIYLPIQQTYQILVSVGITKAGTVQYGD